MTKWSGETNKQADWLADKRRLTDKGALEEQTSRGASVPVEDDSTDGTTHTHTESSPSVTITTGSL